MGITTGSPIQARVEVNILALIFIPLVIIGVFFIIRYFLKKSEEYHKSEKYFEKKKKSPTKKKELSEVVKVSKLTQEEKDILSEICSTHPVPNISYLVKNLQDLEPFYKECFSYYDAQNDENAKTYLFSLRDKIQKAYKKIPQIKNSRGLPDGAIFKFSLSKGIHLTLNLLESRKDDFSVSIPKNLKDSPDAAPPLSVIKLIYVPSYEMAWLLNTRVIRYQEGKENADINYDIMICSHTDKIEPLKRRASERVALMSTCTFASVKIETKQINNKSVIDYIPSEKKHAGILADISNGGCKLITELPIKSEQYIHIEGKFNKKDTENATGIIIRTTKTKESDYSLHVRFIKISTETVNKINAMISRFDEPENVS